VASGSGRSLGEALVELFTTEGRAGGRRSTYDAKGWQAQFSQLSSTKEGYAAMERAGLSATTRTQRGWLTGDAEPTRANRGLIAEAYRVMAGGFNPGWKAETYEVTGRVTMGSDSRVRGRQGNSPLRVDGRSGIWRRIEAEWNGKADPARLEELFVEDVIVEDLGEGSFPWEFDGNRYEVKA
jgi:hypothetical protein